MLKDRKKYAPYITDIFINNIKIHDPMKQLAYIFFFGGASDIQKTGGL